MKSLNFLWIGLFALFVLGSSSCNKDACTTTVTYSTNVADYLTLAEMKVTPVITHPRALDKTGKIFVAGDYLLINELEEGVHIVDNKDPNSPVNVAFIEVEGNVDMAIKGNTLFLDSYLDILTFDVSTPEVPVFLQRSAGAFPAGRFHFDKEKEAYIVGFHKELVTEEVPCGTERQYKGFCGTYDGTIEYSHNSTMPNGNIAGSMASMVIIDAYLYIINLNKLLIFSTDEQPEHLNTVKVDWGIETLFPYKDKLFIGANNGMYIYDNTNPLAPVLLSLFSHARSCDPVYVKGDVAYVTLRGGNACGGFENQLDILDIQDLENPILKGTYAMTNPHGLSVGTDKVFLCDGEDGLKVFTIKGIHGIEQEETYRFEGITAFDVIHVPYKELLIVIAEEGLFQFDISNGLELISKL